nr:hypothetical protein RMC01_pgp130 [Neoporphyra seriata]WKD84027.1 hypothetical protein [Neoporphyra seriata]
MLFTKDFNNYLQLVQYIKLILLILPMSKT